MYHTHINIKICSTVLCYKGHDSAFIEIKVSKDSVNNNENNIDESETEIQYDEIKQYIKVALPAFSDNNTPKNSSCEHYPNYK